MGKGHVFAIISLGYSRFTSMAGKRSLKLIESEKNENFVSKRGEDTWLVCKQFTVNSQIFANTIAIRYILSHNFNINNYKLN